MLAGLTGAAAVKRQPISPLSSSQISSYAPFTHFASTAYCKPSTTTGASDTLAKHSKDGDAGYTSVTEADELEFLGCRVTTARTESVSRDGESFGALS